ncbi:hypothetical protein QJS10_CPB15g02117 [Acorus calamus]|uniref:NDH-dependent cyclic electron flow 5 n=1 Tax=Acorus calamus TaxID=4465 RepID=A0AAV9D869_ACOCL|nr:hypothetical protein QJS10_CPB15g02117 [Acorus calamus]
MTFSFPSSPPNFTPLTPTNPPNNPNPNPKTPIQFSHHIPKSKFSLLASHSDTPPPPFPPINADYLDKEFRVDGVSFEGIGDGDLCVVKMGLDGGGGSAACAAVLLPSGVITSYKAKMWHGSNVEVIHTSVSEGVGGAVIRGGVSVGCGCGVAGERPWWPRSWSLMDVRGSSHNSIQVELISVNPKHGVEFKYLITLQQDLLSSELVVTNMGSSNLQLMGSILSHLEVSSPNATYAVGLQGSSYFNKPPPMSEFLIVPPNFNEKSRSNAKKSQFLEGILSGWSSREQKSTDEAKSGGELSEDVEREEGEDYAQLTEKMSRIYTTAPTKFTVIDRGRRTSVVFGRSGFEELYFLGPGSTYEQYGKYSYICVGPSAVLKPIMLAPERLWRGAQYLFNPNI